jgi:Flp pilus assembly pilin Flp
MIGRALKSERGMSSTEYAGILAIVATIFVVMFALDLDSKVGTTVRTALCQIFGGQCGDPQAAAPEKCLTGKTTTSSNANVFVAFVQIDKDSILIREDYSDGSSKFTIVDNTEAAGKLLAGAKAKAGKYGFNASAEALAGLGLAGGKVFEFDNPEDAKNFQDAVQAAGGFDGIVRDLASYDDEIPIIGVKNPLGGLNDAVLDAIGVDDNGDLPEPDEEYYEGKAFLEGSAGAGGGIGIVDADIAGLINGAGIVKVKTSGENKGDVEFTVRIDGEANGSITAATLGPNAQGKVRLTATITLDAQNGYKPDKLVLKGFAGYTGALGTKLALDGDDLSDVSKALEKVSLSDNQGTGQGFEVSGELDLKDPANLQATLDALAGQNAVPLAQALDERGTLGFDTYNLDTENTEGEVKVGLGVGGGGGGSSSSEEQSDRSGYVRPPGGTFAPRICKQPS